MSRIEMQRFAADLLANAELAAEVQQLGGLDSVVALAQARGYGITVEDVKLYVYDRSADLTKGQATASAGMAARRPRAGKA